MTEAEEIVRRAHPSIESIGDARLEGTCVDAAYIVEHADCAVCLMVAQVGNGGDIRHALCRLNAEEARTLGEALIDRASDQGEDDD